MARSAVLAALSALAACAFDGGGPGGPAPSPPDEVGEPDAGALPEPTSLRVSGTVRDFRDRQAPLEGNFLRVEGVSPPPTVWMSGSTFEITGVPPFSVLYLTASADGHRRTRIAIPVDDTNLDNLEIPILSEEDLASYADDFGFDPTGGLLLARAVDEAGQPKAGVEAEAFQVVSLQEAGSTARGPFFFSASLEPEDAVTTSASGYLLFAELDAGLVSLSGRAPYVLESAAVEISPGEVALTRARVIEGDPALEGSIRFRDHVVPIFSARRCTECHTGSGIGKDRGGLALDGLNGDGRQAWEEITQESSPNTYTTRIDLADPAKSLLLTRPGIEGAPDDHPYTTFFGPTDPDYRTIYTWIQNGAALD